MTHAPAHDPRAPGGAGNGDAAAADFWPDLDRFRRPALVAAGAGLLLLLLGLVIHGGSAFVQAYLYGYVFWTGLSLGCLGLLMLQHLVGGAWGAVIERPLEAGARLLPLMAVLFIPLLFGLFQHHGIYEWTHEEWRAEKAGMGFKLWYLTPAGFIVRTVVYFAVWTALMLLLTSWSARQDRARDPLPVMARRMQLFSGPGLVLFVVTASLAAVDWVMSLTPDWYSTLFGLLWIVGHVLATLALVVVVLARLGARRPLAGVLDAGHFHDLGNLMLAFTMLWAYMHFSQFLIIWSGNLAEETPYYYARTKTGWKYLALALVLFHWLLPFVLLLWRRTKRNPWALASVATWVLAMRFLDLLWVMGPSFAREDAGGHGSYAQAESAARGAVEASQPATDAATQAATAAAGSSHGAGPAGWWHLWMLLAAAAFIGGVWLLAYLWQLRRRPLLPLNDARLVREAHGHGFEVVTTSHAAGAH